MPSHLQGPEGVLPPCLRGDEEKRHAWEKAQRSRKRGKRRRPFAGGAMRLEDFTVAEMKAKLTEKGLRLSGKKAVLIERLREAERQEAEAASTETAAESNPAAASEEPASAT